MSTLLLECGAVPITHLGLPFEKCGTEYTAGRILLPKAAVGYARFNAVLLWPVCFSVTVCLLFGEVGPQKSRSMAQRPGVSDH